jgi:GT2 family glycosyltransferase
MSRVSVIILNWNGRELLKECLDAVAAQTYRDFETLLVDNGSTDGSLEYLREHYPSVRVVVLPENTGFAAGNNRGLAECRGSYIVTLNNDTRVEPEFISKLVHAADTDPAVGMVAAKMLNYHHHAIIDSVGIRVATSGIAYNVGVGERDCGQYDSSVEVFGVCAGAALFRRSMLDEIGFFDPAFFAYYEDVDMAWRCRLAGWKCITAPGAVAYHLQSATSGRMSRFTVYHLQRNKWYVIIKDWPGKLFLKHLPLILCYDLGSILLALFRGRIGSALRARLHVLCNLHLLMRRRREFRSLCHGSVAELERFLDAGEGPLKTFRRKMGSGI